MGYSGKSRKCSLLGFIAKGKGFQFPRLTGETETAPETYVLWVSLHLDQFEEFKDSKANHAFSSRLKLSHLSSQFAQQVGRCLISGVKGMT
jgi:hypothetical protein